jgi:light-regulated signal transduction histidine kinase (bacteriophytochrome)
MTRSEGLLGDGSLRLLLEASSSALLVVDRAERITLMTRGAERLFGYRDGELLGRELELLIPGRFRGPAPSPDAIGRCKDGSGVPIDIGFSSLETPDGHFTLVSIVDVRTRRQAEDELRRTTEDLQQFAYVASHDLQEPLRMVASYTQLLAQRYQGQLDERADKYIHYAVDGAKRMQHLLADLLTYSRVSSQGKPLVPVSADAVAKNVVTSLAEAIRVANASVSVGELPTVRADPSQLGQLLQLLLDNALKFRAEARPVVEISATPLNDRWQFAVKDNGIGIGSQQMDRIFQMFQRFHERGRYEGTGAGLAIAKRIVERHGGRIWLESAPQAGSTFFFTLEAAASLGQP